MAFSNSILAAALVAAALVAAPVVALADTAAAEMINTDGAVIGKATFEQTPHGVLMNVEVAGLPPGAHGIHLHAVGACTPDFTAATCSSTPTAPRGRSSSPSWCRSPAAKCRRCWTRTARR